jgi:uncharacterized protein YjiS (DUF1127 family)
MEGDMTTIVLTDLRLFASSSRATSAGSATLCRACQWLGFAASVERTLRSLWLRLIAWHIRRGTRAALRSLDDRTLRDIGLTRGEIESAAQDFDAILARRARAARRHAYGVA